MIRRHCRRVLALALGLLGAAHALAAEPRYTVAITGVMVVDVEAGRAIGPRTVLVGDGRILAIASPETAVVPDGAERVDGRGRFLIPGLVDMHVHLFNLSTHRPPNDWMFPLLVGNGVTAVRDMRADAPSLAQDAQWRRQVEDGTLVAPRIVADGIPVFGDSPRDAARQVDAAADAGADFIKVFSEIPEANWRAALAEAKARAIPLVGHVPAGVAQLASARAGQRSAEHLMQTYEACSRVQSRVLRARRGLAGDALVARRDEDEAQVLAAFDPGTCRRFARALAGTGQFQVPTLALSEEDDVAAAGHPERDPRWRLMREDEHPRWQRFFAGYTAHDAQLARQRWPIARRIVGILDQAGVPIMAGTDSPNPGVYPGYSLHEELAMLVASGLTPAAALRSATSRPAQFLGIEADAGTVAVGKRADLVLLDGDPTVDIANTRRIQAVLLAGRLFRRADLDALLR
jgi:imidazolonepropionase-like amidohydrolase